MDIHQKLNRILDDSIKDKNRLLIVMDREEKITNHLYQAIFDIVNGGNSKDIIEKTSHLINEEKVKANIKLSQLNKDI